jgi:hypothetical protein
MSRTWTKRLVVLMAAACLALAATPAQAQLAVVTVKSVDDVLDAAKVLAEKAGEGDKAKQFLGIARLALGGIDTTQPLGVYAGVPTGGAQPPIVGFIPITKEDDLLDQLKQFQIDVGKPEKDVRTVTGPNGQTVYLRFAHKHAYVSDKSDLLEGKLPEPGKFLLEASKTHLIAAGVRLNELPKKLRQDTVAEMKKNLEKEQAKKDGETDAAYAGRMFGMKAAEEFATSVILDAADVTLGLKLDAKTDKLLIDLSMTAAAGSTLANQTKKLGSLRSKFAALAADSAFNLLCQLPVSEDIRKSFGKVVEMGFRETLDKEADADKKKLAERAFNAVRDCFATETLDFGVFLAGPYDDKLVSFVAGYHVKNGKMLDEQFRVFAKDSKDGEVKLDVEKVGGVAIHRITPKEKVDEKSQKLFGSNEVYICFREDAALVTLGKHGLSALKDALGRLDNVTASKDTDAVQMEFSFLKIAKMDGSFKPAEAEAIRKALDGVAKGADRVRISLKGGDSLRVRLDMSLEMVKAAVALGKVRQEADQ